ncbi:hypothetical protein TNCV_4270361 [Trichonephila clavipes]|nr:hypothetical protein TNCV_4270361 [Trichonephila clavipes]
MATGSYLTTNYSRSQRGTLHSLRSTGTVPLWHRDTLNSRRAASPLMWLVEGVERCEAPDHPYVSSLKIRVEMIQILLSPVWCSKLWLTTDVT